MNIDELLKLPESKTLEFKRDLSSPEKVLITAIAFANTAGGTIILGVEDKTKFVRGIPDPLALETRIASMITDSIEPKIIPNIEIVPWRKTYLLKIEIFPSSCRPHYLKNKGVDKGTYVRVGSTNRPADTLLLQELRRYTKTESFDEQPFPQLNSEVIDTAAASELFSEHRKLNASDYETLKLITTYQGKKVATNGGVLLFGKERLQHFPDAWIKAGCFDGIDKHNKLIDSLDITAYPALAVKQAVEFVQKHSMKSSEIGSTTRTDKWSMPPIAIREAIINAVVHADYSQRGSPIRLSIFDNRIEIENPGTLPFNLTLDDIRQGISKLRNPVIGRVFYELKLIEQWGSGIKKITEACHDAGLDAPVLEEVWPHFRITIFKNRKLFHRLSEIENAVVHALGQSEGLSTQDIAKKVKRTTRATRTLLLRLIDLGIVSEIATSPQDPHRKYYLIKKT